MPTSDDDVIYEPGEQVEFLPTIGLREWTPATVTRHVPPGDGPVADTIGVRTDSMVEVLIGRDRIRRPQQAI